MARAGGTVRRRRRVAALAALSLLLGLITMWLVAWAFALWEAPVIPAVPSFVVGVTDDDRIFNVGRGGGFGTVWAEVLAGRHEGAAELKAVAGDFYVDGQLALGCTSADRVLPRWTASHTAAREGRLTPEETSSARRVYLTVSGQTLVFDHNTFEYGAGWPCICVRSRTCDMPGPRAPTGGVTQSIRLPNWVQNRVPGVQATTIPRELMLRGFAVNTLFYTTLWLLLLGFRPLRRWRRVGLGRCPMCNYDLCGELDAGCPECGWERSEEGEPI